MHVDFFFKSYLSKDGLHVIVLEAANRRVSQASSKGAVEVKKTGIHVLLALFSRICIVVTAVATVTWYRPCDALHSTSRARIGHRNAVSKLVVLVTKHDFSVPTHGVEDINYLRI